MIVFVVLAIGIVIYASGVWLRSGVYLRRVEFDPEHKNRVLLICNDRPLRVVNWNISYAFGLGSDGPGYSPKPKSDFLRRLDTLSDVIRSKDPDIVFLQEVDFSSNRSHKINQARYLMQKLQFPYAADCLSWAAGYVPFPYWPISWHFKKIYSGGCVLSRFPIQENKCVLYKKPRHKPWWYRLFYIRRYSQWVRFQMGEQSLVAINNHFEADDSETRNKQAELLANEIRDYQGNVFLVAGDFNSLPVQAKKRSLFSRYPQDNYEADTVIGTMSKVTKLKDIHSDLEYVTNEESSFTFPADNPCRKLDFIFIGKNYKVIQKEILLVGEISDHLPLFAEIELVG